MPQVDHGGWWPERANQRIGDMSLDLFDRINTGSKSANPSEVRRGALPGPFQDLVNELAMEPTFIELAPMSPKQAKERIREELVTRFFAYGDGLDDYKDDPKRFLYVYVGRMNGRFKTDASLATSYKRRFRETMSFVASVFPYGFRKSETGKATPRSRFEAIAIGSDLALRENPSLSGATPEVMSWLTSEKFDDTVGSDGANGKNRLLGRIRFVKERLLGA